MYNKIKGYMTNNVVGNAFSLILAITFFLVIANFEQISQQFSNITKILSPFIYGFGLAFILNKPILWFENKVYCKVKNNKGISIASAYLCFFLIVYALCVAIIPQTVGTLKSILITVPSFVENASKIITEFFTENQLNENIMDEVYSAWQSASQYITNIATNIISQIVSASISLGSVVVNTLTALIASIYMHIYKDTLIFQIKKLIYAISTEKFATRLLQIGVRSNNIFSGFLIGKMIDSAIIGVITFICMLFIYHPFALLIAVIIGATNMIPFFGPFIGAVPCAFILLMVSPTTTLIFIIFVIILQQVDGNIIGPKILGDSTGLSAFWVLVSIIVGNGLFGILGMLIGVPTFAVIYSVLSENVSEKLKLKKVKIDDVNKKITY